MHDNPYSSENYMHRWIFNVVQTQCPWGNPLRSSPECLDTLLDDSRACLARCPLTLLLLGTPGTVLFALSRTLVGVVGTFLWELEGKEARIF